MGSGGQGTGDDGLGSGGEEVTDCPMCKKLSETFLEHLISIAKLIELNEIEHCEKNLIELIEQLKTCGIFVEKKEVTAEQLAEFWKSRMIKLGVLSQKEIDDAIKLFGDNWVEDSKALLNFMMKSERFTTTLRLTR